MQESDKEKWIKQIVYMTDMSNTILFCKCAWRVCNSVLNILPGEQSLSYQWVSEWRDYFYFGCVYTACEGCSEYLGLERSEYMCSIFHRAFRLSVLSFPSGLLSPTLQETGQWYIDAAPVFFTHIHTYNHKHFTNSWQTRNMSMPVICAYTLGHPIFVRDWITTNELQE